MGREINVCGTEEKHIKCYKFLAAVALAASVTSFGCQSRTQLAAELEQEAAPLLLAGYTELRFEMGDVDVGYFIYSYRIPAGIRAEDVIPKVTARLRTLRACYNVVRESSSSAVLRCRDPERSKRFNFIEEFGFHMAVQKGRLYVIEIIDVPPNSQRHEQFLRGLEEVGNW